jgi:carbon-monoxide dehydrogenase small subunit
MTVAVEMVVNGTTVALDVDDDELLGDALRDRLGLLSIRFGCHEGVCGTCTIVVDGRPARGCLLLAAQVDGAVIETVEGLAGDDGMHPIQEAFVAHGALQCGYCTSGFLMATQALLAAHPDPTEEQIREGLAGNICRCTGYMKIIDAVTAAAQQGGAVQ